MFFSGGLLEEGVLLQKLSGHGRKAVQQRRNFQELQQQSGQLSSQKHILK
jgi:hypothetical protein